MTYFQTRQHWISPTSRTKKRWNGWTPGVRPAVNVIKTESTSPVESNLSDKVEIWPGGTREDTFCTPAQPVPRRTALTSVIGRISYGRTVKPLIRDGVSSLPEPYERTINPKQSVFRHLEMWSERLHWCDSGCDLTLDFTCPS